MKDKVLVLGANGFMGRHFQDFIMAHRLLDRYAFTLVDTSIAKGPDIVRKKVDLLDYRAFEMLLRTEVPDYVINFAGTFRAPNAILMEKINAGIARDLFEIVLAQGIPVKNILLIGSAAEYGSNTQLPLKEDFTLQPTSSYGFSKVLQTQYAHFYFSNFNINVNLARAFNVVGSGISPLLSIGTFISQIRTAKDRGTIYVGNLNTRRDFLDIQDVLAAFWKILLKGKKGKVYNVCSGKSYCMRDILQFLIERSGKKISVAIRKEYIKKNDVQDSFGDNVKLRRDTGWKEKSDIFAALSKALREDGYVS